MDKEWWYRCRNTRRKHSIMVLQWPPAVSRCISKFPTDHQRRGKVKELQWLLGVPVMAEAFHHHRLWGQLCLLYFVQILSRRSGWTNLTGEVNIFDISGAMRINIYTWFCMNKSAAVINLEVSDAHLGLLISWNSFSPGALRSWITNSSISYPKDGQWTRGKSTSN